MYSFDLMFYFLECTSTKKKPHRDVTKCSMCGFVREYYLRLFNPSHFIKFIMIRPNSEGKANQLIPCITF